MKAFAIKIAPDARVSAIYSDALSPLLREGEAVIRRASHVEPNPEGEGWIADMSPSSGPVLGPFPLRGDALAAEVRWLEAKLF